MIFSVDGSGRRDMERHKLIVCCLDVDPASSLGGQRKSIKKEEQGHCWSVQDRETSDGGP